MTWPVVVLLLSAAVCLVQAFHESVKTDAKKKRKS